MQDSQGDVVGGDTGVGGAGVDVLAGLAGVVTVFDGYADGLVDVGTLDQPVGS